MTARPQDVALLPCPFCGATPTMDNIRADESQGWKWGAVICGCGVVGPEVRTGYSAVEVWSGHAITEWNTRANVTAALASAQAREEELRADRDSWAQQASDRAADWHAEHQRAERLEEALRDLRQNYEVLQMLLRRDWQVVYIGTKKYQLTLTVNPDYMERINAALSTNAATQTGETR